MIFELRTHHLARLLTGLCAIPILWTFMIEGVTTTTEYDLATGESSSSNDLGSQLGGVAIWVVLAIIFGVAAWAFEKQRTEWPEPVKEQLRSIKLAPAASSGSTDD